MHNFYTWAVYVLVCDMLARFECNLCIFTKVSWIGQTERKDPVPNGCKMKECGVCIGPLTLCTVHDMCVCVCVLYLYGVCVCVCVCV